MGGVVGACAPMCVSSQFSEKGVNKSEEKTKDVNVDGLSFSVSEFLGLYKTRFRIFSLIKPFIR